MFSLPDVNVNFYVCERALPPPPPRLKLSVNIHVNDKSIYNRQTLNFI